MRYLCRLKQSIRGFKKGEVIIFPESFVKMFSRYLEVLKEYPDVINMVKK